MFSYHWASGPESSMMLYFNKVHLVAAPAGHQTTSVWSSLSERSTGGRSPLPMIAPFSSLSFTVTSCRRASAVTEMPGESTLRKNFQQLQEGEGRRTPNPLYHAQPAFFADRDNVPPKSQQAQQPVAAPRSSHLAAVQPTRPQQQQQQQRHHIQVMRADIFGQMLKYGWGYALD